jgi:hypothetical protein
MPPPYSLEEIERLITSDAARRGPRRQVNHSTTSTPEIEMAKAKRNEAARALYAAKKAAERERELNAAMGINNDDDSDNDDSEDEEGESEDNDSEEEKKNANGSKTVKGMSIKHGTVYETEITTRKNEMFIYLKKANMMNL